MSAHGFGHHDVEAALRESEERFRAIFSQAAVGMAQSGLDGKWLLVNNRFCEMLGYPEAELLRMTWQDITHPDDRDEALAGRLKLLAGEVCSHTMETRYFRKDGNVLWGRLNRSLVRDRENQPKYIIAVVEALRGYGQRVPFATASKGSEPPSFKRLLALPRPASKGNGCF